MRTDTTSAREKAAYARRFMRLAPELAARAVRNDNLAFHTVRSLDKTEAVLTYYLETTLIRKAERFEQWWNDAVYSYWQI